MLVKKLILTAIITLTITQIILKIIIYNLKHHKVEQRIQRLKYKVLIINLIKLPQTRLILLLSIL
jgi:hypothetical protein